MDAAFKGSGAYEMTTLDSEHHEGQPDERTQEAFALVSAGVGHLRRSLRSMGLKMERTNDAVAAAAARLQRQVARMERLKERMTTVEEKLLQREERDSCSSGRSSRRSSVLLQCSSRRSSIHLQRSSGASSFPDHSYLESIARLLLSIPAKRPSPVLAPSLPAAPRCKSRSPVADAANPSSFTVTVKRGSPICSSSSSSTCPKVCSSAASGTCHVCTGTCTSPSTSELSPTPSSPVCTSSLSNIYFKERSPAASGTSHVCTGTCTSPSPLEVSPKSSTPICNSSLSNICFKERSPAAFGTCHVCTGTCTTPSPLEVSPKPSSPVCTSSLSNVCENARSPAASPIRRVCTGTCTNPLPVSVKPTPPVCVSSLFICQKARSPVVSATKRVSTGTCTTPSLLTIFVKPTSPVSTSSLSHVCQKARSPAASATSHVSVAVPAKHTSAICTSSLTDVCKKIRSPPASSTSAIPQTVPAKHTSGACESSFSDICPQSRSIAASAFSQPQLRVSNKLTSPVHVVSSSGVGQDLPSLAGPSISPFALEEESNSRTTVGTDIPAEPDLQSRSSSKQPQPLLVNSSCSSSPTCNVATETTACFYPKFVDGPVKATASTQTVSFKSSSDAAKCGRCFKTDYALFTSDCVTPNFKTFPEPRSSGCTSRQSSSVVCHCPSSVGERRMSASDIPETISRSAPCVTLSNTNMASSSGFYDCDDDSQFSSVSVFNEGSHCFSYYPFQECVSQRIMWVASPYNSPLCYYVPVIDKSFHPICQHEDAAVAFSFPPNAGPEFCAPSVVVVPPVSAASKSFPRSRLSSPAPRPSPPKPRTFPSVILDSCSTLHVPKSTSETRLNGRSSPSANVPKSVPRPISSSLSLDVSPVSNSSSRPLITETINSSSSPGSPSSSSSLVVHGHAVPPESMCHPTLNECKPKSESMCSLITSCSPDMPVSRPACYCRTVQPKHTFPLQAKINSKCPQTLSPSQSIPLIRNTRNNEEVKSCSASNIVKSICGFKSDEPSPDVSLDVSMSISQPTSCSHSLNDSSYTSVASDSRRPTSTAYSRFSSSRPLLASTPLASASNPFNDAVTESKSTAYSRFSSSRPLLASTPPASASNPFNDAVTESNPTAYSRLSSSRPPPTSNPPASASTPFNDTVKESKCNIESSGSPDIVVSVCRPPSCSLSLGASIRVSSASDGNCRVTSPENPRPASSQIPPPPPPTPVKYIYRSESIVRSSDATVGRTISMSTFSIHSDANSGPSSTCSNSRPASNDTSSNKARYRFRPDEGIPSSNVANVHKNVIWPHVPYIGTPTSRPSSDHTFVKGNSTLIAISPPRKGVSETTFVMDHPNNNSCPYVSCSPSPLHHSTPNRVPVKGSISSPSVARKLRHLVRPSASLGNKPNLGRARPNAEPARGTNVRQCTFGSRSLFKPHAVQSTMNITSSYARESNPTKAIYRETGLWSVPVTDSEDAKLGRKLLKAAQEGKAAAVGRLLDQGADVNFAFATKWTALHRAVKTGREKVVSLLLERGADLEAKTTYDFTPLHIAAYYDRAGRCLARLIDAGPDLDCRNRSGKTALHYASEVGNETAVEALVAAGAHTEMLDDQGKTPYDVAKEASTRKLLVSLVTNG